MRARLENADGTFVAEVESPDWGSYIRFGERYFVSTGSGTPVVFEEIEVFSAPTEGALVVEP